MKNKIDLGGVKTSASAAKANHPIVEITDKDTMTLLEQFALINPQFKTLENQSKTLSKQLAPKIRAIYFNRLAGMAPDSSTVVVVAGGRSIKLTVKEQYSKTVTDEAALVAAIGQELVDLHFRQATVLKLDLDKCPESKQEAFATGVLALAKALEVSDAVTASQCIQPNAGFHEQRTTLLTIEQNLALDAALPVTAYPQL
jgi:hypothetical protein